MAGCLHNFADYSESPTCDLTTPMWHASVGDLAPLFSTCIYIETFQQLEDITAPNPNCSVYVQYSTVGHFGFVLWLCALALASALALSVISSHRDSPVSKETV